MCLRSSHWGALGLLPQTPIWRKPYCFDAVWIYLTLSPKEHAALEVISSDLNRSWSADVAELVGQGVVVSVLAGRMINNSALSRGGYGLPMMSASRSAQFSLSFKQVTILATNFGLEI